VLVSDADMSAAWVTSHVPPIVTDRARLEAMSKAASDLVPRDADERLARIVLETAQRGGSR
jgi:UDP-N-acetylglucosamine--N-acetylmuramyl-(pentapeptide) pyrophosphoryl-undecaprenol N-acetylglucosamine transferase